MLPYLDNQPLWAAANFSWNCWYDVGYNVNSTVFNTRLAFFLCPSDGKSGPPNTNNYMGSMGTATNPWTLLGSGLFSNQTCSSYSTPERRLDDHDRFLRGAGLRLRCIASTTAMASPPAVGSAGSGDSAAAQPGRGHGRPADLHPVVAVQASDSSAARTRATAGPPARRA